MLKGKEETFSLKICPNCGKTFRCYEQNIQLCQCSKIQLKQSVKDIIKEKFGDCLCIDCLIVLSKEEGRKND